MRRSAKSPRAEATCCCWLCLLCTSAASSSAWAAAASAAACACGVSNSGDPTAGLGGGMLCAAQGAGARGEVPATIAGWAAYATWPATAGWAGAAGASSSSSDRVRSIAAGSCCVVGTARGGVRSVAAAAGTWGPSATGVTARLPFLEPAGVFPCPGLGCCPGLATPVLLGLLMSVGDSFCTLAGLGLSSMGCPCCWPVLLGLACAASYLQTHHAQVQQPL